MATRERRTGGRGGLGGALVVFVILCGVLLLLLGGGDAPAEEADDQPAEDEAFWAAYDSTEEAHRALINADYGEAREHVRDIKQEMNEMAKARAGQRD